MSLSDISQCVLGAPIDKDPQRSVWNMADLSPDLQNYAAIDARAGLAIYSVAANHPLVGADIYPTCLVGSSVDVKPLRTSQVVASGEVVVNGATTVVRITKVNVPGYLANGVALQAYGEPPFELSVPASHLITAATTSEASSSSSENPAFTNYPVITVPVSNLNAILDSEI